MRRRHVEGKVGSGAAVGRELNGRDLARPRTARDVCDFSAVTFFDRRVAHAVVDCPINGGVGQTNIERHAVVMRGERLQVGADLVAYIAGRRGAVGADDAEVDSAVLHAVATRVVNDDRV